MRISVIGLGKIGLPLAVQFASKGHEVIGLDVNEMTVNLINQGIEPFPGEHNLQTLLKEVVSDNLLAATTSPQDSIAGCDVVVVAVPLYVDEKSQPDFEMLDAATINIAKYMFHGTLVAYETTLPIGTTRNRLTPMLMEWSKLQVGSDFYVVFSPERVFTGRVFADLRKYPKLVGGVDSLSSRRGVEFYESVLDFDPRPDLGQSNGVWDMGSAEAAEFTKLAETTYRDVNIALANQFAHFAENNGMNVYEIIEAANSQPFSHIHSPGISVGGHCIPVYPKLYLSSDQDAALVRMAREYNEVVPILQVQRLAEKLGDLQGLRIVILGLAYRGGVKEAAFSGTFKLVSALESHGAAVSVHDPLFTNHEIIQFGFVPFQRGNSGDVVILHTDHSEYKEWSYFDVPGCKFILDGRDFLDSSNWQQVELIRLGHGEIR